MLGGMETEHKQRVALPLSKKKKTKRIEQLLIPWSPFQSNTVDLRRSEVSLLTRPSQLGKDELKDSKSGYKQNASGKHRRSVRVCN